MMVLRLVPLRAWLDIALVAVLSAGGWWGLREYRAVQAAKDQVLVLNRELFETRLALEVERARAEADADAVSEAINAAHARQVKLDALLEDIERSPDGPVAPVLLDTLRRLK